jgi:hypothetical protein
VDGQRHGNGRHPKNAGDWSFRAKLAKKKGPGEPRFEASFEA